MKHIYNDGGRAAAGFKGKAGDCVARAVAIASEQPYAEVYDILANGMGSQRITKKRHSKGRSARNGVSTKRKWFKDYMKSLGFKWTATMGIGTGCKVHLRKFDLPMGRIIARVTHHYVAVIDGVINDTFDCSRNGTRCVYGYWSK